PFESSFAMRDGLFTIVDIVLSWLQNSEFAFRISYRAVPLLRMTNQISMWRFIFPQRCNSWGSAVR
ncbi:hypothetical protein BDR07DRAFT_1297188, partial [Suillus spraguei]